ncbi:MAG: biotin/lipoyl-binding protein [Candidatus Omnitrophota bacterium]|jgi:pyruvate dehydrogenase E2 component (dihydrolipoamide acetyltransferase)
MKQVILPELGEGIEGASVTYWYFKEGDTVKEKEDLVELATDKATFNLPSPCSGALKKILCKDGDKVKVGEALATIEEQ